MSETRLYCTFYVGNRLLGVAVDDVQEVLRYQEMTSVPLADGVVQGLINLRGEIVTAIDLRRRLSLSERATGRPPTNVVVHTEDGAVSLLVDEIGEILEVDESSFEPNASVGVENELLKGVYKLDGELLLVLDTERAVAVTA